MVHGSLITKAPLESRGKALLGRAGEGTHEDPGRGVGAGPGEARGPGRVGVGRASRLQDTDPTEDQVRWRPSCCPGVEGKGEGSPLRAPSLPERHAHLPGVSGGLEELPAQGRLTSSAPPAFASLASPVPRIKWRKVDGSLSPQWATAEPTLQIPSVSFEDEGTYECEAENSRGRDSVQGRIIVQGMNPGRPSPPSPLSPRESSARKSGGRLGSPVLQPSGARVALATGTRG